MKKRNIILTAALAAVALTAPEAGISQQTMIADEVVAVVGSSMILYSDLVRTRDELAARQAEMGYTSNLNPQCEAFEMLLNQKLLANQARLDSLEGDTGAVEQMVEEEMDKLYDQYGSQSVLEAEYHRPVYQIRDDLRDRFTDMMLASVMEREVRSKVSIIPAEVDRYFQKLNKDSLSMIPEQYVYAHIILYPPSLEEAKLRAREQLLALRQRIIDGQRFNALAQMYSQDPGSASTGGEPAQEIPIDYLHRPFAEAVKRLRPGQLSSIVETEDGFHLIELLEHSGNRYRWRHILIRPEYTSTEMAETAQRLDSIGNLIRTGAMTFEAAALKHSQDEHSKYNGGEVTNHEIIELYGQGNARNTSNRFTLELLGQTGNDHMYLRSMKQGEISSSYRTNDLRGNQQVKIIKLLQVIPAHRADLKEDYAMVEDAALQQKQQRVYDEWLRKTIASMYIRINPKYRHCDFQVKGWIK